MSKGNLAWKDCQRKIARGEYGKLKSIHWMSEEAEQQGLVTFP